MSDDLRESTISSSFYDKADSTSTSFDWALSTASWSGRLPRVWSTNRVRATSMTALAMEAKSLGWVRWDICSVTWGGHSDEEEGLSCGGSGRGGC
ncbi:hypothetical protein NL676_019456 [Syzygium grande]|nr:hypothetical protein NL676_019456 [Syzygium grande]